MSRRRSLFAALALAAVGVLAGCGSGGGVTAPTVQPARTFGLEGFEPSGPVSPGRPTVVSFTIRTPSGKPLTQYKTCCDPHAGVDVLVVRSDDSHVQYIDADAEPDGRVSVPVVFPAPGRYRIVVDAYPKVTGPDTPFNFQLFTWVTVRGAYRPKALPSFQQTEVVDGYRFRIEGHPRLRAIEPGFLVFHVTDPTGRKTVFTTWRGALAHAIFFHQGDLAYSHTHVCKPGAIYCFSVLGNVRVTGQSTTPGILKAGVLLPESGTWRLFLLTYLSGRVLTVPFTLHVR
ncbi:MAG TPA: hypothetical protein VKR79_11965 [Gaiellaceae bacterium]|nr:hypothetical protein [Gaiellaceae bacterium]